MKMNKINDGDLIAIIQRHRGLGVFITRAELIARWEQYGASSELLPDKPTPFHKWLCELIDAQWGWIGSASDFIQIDPEYQGMSELDIIENLKKLNDHWMNWEKIRQSELTITSEQAERMLADAVNAEREIFAENVKVRLICRDPSGTYHLGANILPELLAGCPVISSIGEILDKPETLNQLTNWLETEHCYELVDGFAGWGEVMISTDGSHHICITTD